MSAQLVERLSRPIETLAAGALMALMCLVFVSVVLRFFFNAPIKDAFDLSRMFLGVTVFWGIAAACGRDEYVRGDVLFDRMGPRTRLVVDLFGRVVVVGFAGVMAWQVIGKALDVRRGGEVTSELQLLIWPFVLVMGAGAALTLVVVLLHLVQALRADGREGGRAASKPGAALPTEEDAP